MKKIYIAAAKRTAIGSFMGALKDVHPSQMGAAVVKAIMEENNLPPGALDEVIVGNVLPAGLGQGIARQTAVYGGVSYDVPAYTVNHVCCSGMKAVMNAADSIKAGQAELIIAGGVESMSGAPFILPGKIRGGNKLGAITAVDHMEYDSLTDAFHKYHMGITAENVAEKYGITREVQDLYALESQRKAIAAVDAGHFVNEIVPMTVKVGRSEIIFDKDEYPNRTTTPEKMATLRAAFKKDGTVTAGNASGINDGASMMLIAGEEAIKKYNLTPLAEIISYAQAGVDPAAMGLGPVPAITKALAKASLAPVLTNDSLTPTVANTSPAPSLTNASLTPTLTNISLTPTLTNASLALKDMDLLELNEAFAAQALGVVHGLSDEHGLSREAIMEKTNISGGAIALGHPIGASGNRILVTLLHGLIRTGRIYGLASLCAGGGMGCAVIIKKL